MRLFKPSSCLAALFLVAVQFATPTHSHADSYTIVGSWSENTWGFDGIDPYGDVYLLYEIPSSDYQTKILSPTGSSVIISSNAPLTFVSDRGSYCQESLPGFPHVLNGICNGELFAFLYAADGGPDTSLYKYSGIGTAQLVTSATFGDLFAMDNLGDIVFDNGFVDTAYYAVDLTAHVTPEPSSLLLLASGVIAAAGTIRRRRVA